MNRCENFQGYVVQLRAEHRRLHEAVQRIERDLAREGGLASAALEDVWALRAELAHHFAEEAEGGCLEEAVCQCPDLGPEADAIERQHPELLRAIDEIVTLLRALPAGAAPTDEARDAFRMFAKALHAHEAAENRILERAFGADMSD